MGRVVPLLLLFAGCGWEERPTCTVTEEVLDRVEDAELGVDTEALDALLGAEHVGLGEHADGSEVEVRVRLPRSDGEVRLIRREPSTTREFSWGIPGPRPFFAGGECEDYVSVMVAAEIEADDFTYAEVMEANVSLVDGDPVANLYAEVPPDHVAFPSFGEAIADPGGEPDRAFVHVSASAGSTRGTAGWEGADESSAWVDYLLIWVAAEG